MTVVYKSSEVMKLLDLKESVFKKYVSLIEKEGFVFQKNSQGHRMFSELDVQTIETFIKLSRYDGVTLESVAKKVAEWRKNKSHDGMTDKEIQEHSITPSDTKGYDVMTLIDSLLQEQEQRFTSQIQQLIQQQKEITIKQDEKLNQILLHLDRIDQREQERNRMIQEEKEAQMQIAAAQEKKSWWYRFLGK